MAGEGQMICKFHDNFFPDTDLLLYSNPDPHKEIILYPSGSWFVPTTLPRWLMIMKLEALVMLRKVNVGGADWSRKLAIPPPLMHSSYPFCIGFYCRMNGTSHIKIIYPAKVYSPLNTALIIRAINMYFRLCSLTLPFILNPFTFHNAWQIYSVSKLAGEKPGGAQVPLPGLLKNRNFLGYYWEWKDMLRDEVYRYHLLGFGSTLKSSWWASLNKTITCHV